MAPEVGFEPTTNRLTADRSTTELLRNCAPKLAGRNKCITEGVAATTFFVKLFSGSRVYWLVKVFLFLLLASMFYVAMRAGAAPSAADVRCV